MEALNAHILDQFSLGALFVITILVLALFIELGFLLGRRLQRKSVKAQTSQVRAIMGAGLGLLAFMLAFTFATAQSHFENRVALMVEEVRLVNNAFLQAELMSEPYRSEARGLLREYMGDRLKMDELTANKNYRAAFDLIEKSEAMHLALWSLAVEQERAQRGNLASRPQRDPFMLSVIGIIDVQSARLQAAMMNRIPYVIWLTLYMVGCLSMLVVGYQAGLVSKRSPIATVTLAIAFAGVMMLIMDLDRPVMSLFDINNQVVVDLVERMDILLASPHDGA